MFAKEYARRETKFLTLLRSHVVQRGRITVSAGVVMHQNKPRGRIFNQHRLQPLNGKTHVDVAEILIPTAHKNITVAVMGCAVNGPGEAREADLGIACGKGEALMFRHGKILKKVPIENAADELMKEIEEF